MFSKQLYLINLFIKKFSLICVFNLNISFEKFIFLKLNLINFPRINFCLKRGIKGSRNKVKCQKIKILFVYYNKNFKQECLINTF